MTAANPDAPVPSSGRRWWLVRVVLPVALAALAWLVWTHRGEVAGILAHASPAWLAGSIVLLAASNRCASEAFGYALAGAGDGRLAARAACAYQIGQVAKYVPGRIWSAVLQIGLLPPGIGAGRVLLVNVALAVAACAVMGGVGGAALLWNSYPLAATAALLAGVVVATLVMCDGQPGRWANLLLGFLRRPAPAVAGTAVATAPSRSRMFGALAGYALGAFAGWTAFFAGGLGLGLEAGLQAAGAGALAWIVGLLSLLPAGAGSRELAFVAFPAAGPLTTGDLLGLALASRLALVIVDATSAAAGWIEWRWRRLGGTG